MLERSHRLPHIGHDIKNCDIKVLIILNIDILLTDPKIAHRTPFSNNAVIVIKSEKHYLLYNKHPNTYYVIKQKIANHEFITYHTKTTYVHTTYRLMRKMATLANIKLYKTNIS